MANFLADDIDFAEYMDLTEHDQRVISSGQHVAVHIHDLPAAKELQAQLEPVGQLVLAGFLHVLKGDRFQAGTDVLGGLLCVFEAGSAELQILTPPLGRLRNAAAALSGGR